MLRMTYRASLTLMAALAPLFILSACGGGGGSGGGGAVSVEPSTPAPVQITLASGYTAISSAAGLSKPNWPAWSHTGTDPVGGVGCYKVGTYHTHALLSIYRDGVRLASPGSIGRDTGCEYELHTHEGSGTIHIETDTQKVFTLGQYFLLWGQDLSEASVAGLPGKPSYFVIENEQITRVTTNPADITLTPHKEIVIITGVPPKEVPKYDWGSSTL
jgi:hypothetical protein